MGPVACLIHVDLVPRRAVRKVGPRPDLTRSTHIGEPCGPARLLGDGSWSSRPPYRATYQSTGGDGKKNGGRNPPAPGNRCAEPPGGLLPPRGLRRFRRFRAASLASRVTHRQFSRSETRAPSHLGAYASCESHSPPNTTIPTSAGSPSMCITSRSS